MTRYWIGVASRDHVRVGAAGGFGQLCHGARSPLARLAPGDGIAYYSPREAMGAGAAVQAFTAIGTVEDDVLTQVDMGSGFTPFRRRIRFAAEAHDAPIRPLLARLSFTAGRANWGMQFRRGLFAISAEDYALIAAAMGAARS